MGDDPLPQFAQDINRIRKMSKAEVDAYIERGEYGAIEFACALQHRASFPDWSVKGGFIISVLAMVFAGIAAFPVVQAWLQKLSVQAAPDATTSQSPQRIEAAKQSPAQSPSDSSILYSSPKP